MSMTIDAGNSTAAKMNAMAPGLPATAWQWVRLIGNFINLTTLFGLGVALVGGATIRRGPRGLFLAEGYKLRFPIAGAFTIGNVITTGSTFDQKLTEYPGLLQHEERHTWQYLACIGLPFYLLYAACMGWSWLRTGDRASRNFFERHAGLAIGGYPDLPVRPISAGFADLWRRVRKIGELRHS